VADRVVNFKVLADSAQFDAAMAKAGASTKALSKTMDQAAKQSEQLARATNEARTAALEAAAAERAAAAAQDKSATAAKKATRARTEQAEANRVAADAAQKLERGEITAAEAQKLSAKAARADRDAQIANAAAERAAAAEAEKLERAAIKASVAQLAQAKAARAAGAAAGSRGLTRKQGRSLLGSLVGDGVVVGEQAAKAFMSGFESAVEDGASGIKKILADAGVSAGEVVAPALVGAIAGAAPFIISALGGALIAGVGAAGIGLAVAGQIKSPAVRNAWTALGHYAQKTLADVTSPLEDDLVKAAEQFGYTLDLHTDSLRRAFRQLGPDITILAKGIGDFIGPILDELPDVMHAFGPVVSELSVDMGRLGGDIAEFLHVISSDSAGAADGLRVVFAVLSAGLKVVGYTIAGAETIVHGFFNTIELIARAMALIPSPFQKDWKAVADAFSETARQSATASTGVKQLGGSLDGSGTSAENAKQKFSDLIAKMAALSNAAGDLAHSQVSADQAVDALTESIRANGKAFSGNTAAAHANQAALADATDKAAEAADAKYKETGSISQANAEYDRYINKLKATLRQAGLTDGQINTLIDTYATVPDYVQTLIKDPGAVSSTANVKDLRDAQKTLERLIKVAVKTHAPKNQVEALKKALAALHDKQVHVSVTTSYYEGPHGQAVHGSVFYGGGGRAEADGGILEYRAFANGGFHDPAHVAEIVPAGTMRLMAEPETGGEAYIPLAPSKRARSSAILTEVARRFGMPVGQPAAVSAAAPAASAPSAAAIGQAAASALTAQLDPALREVASAIALDKVLKVGATEFARLSASTTKFRSPALQGRPRT